jgi:hypothetical protein
MRSQDSRGGHGRRSGRGGQRRSSSRSHNDRNRGPRPQPQAQAAPAKKTLWQKILSFFQPSAKPAASKPRPAYPGNGQTNGRKETRPALRPADINLTTAKLFVGNLSYSASDEDLNELFKGVGIVKNAEVVTHKQTDKSKGFGFVLMATVDEAKRAIIELHDKDFMGRKLIVNEAKATDRETHYRD